MSAILEYMEIHPDVVTAMSAARGWTNRIESFTHNGRFVMDASLGAVKLLHGANIDASLTSWEQDGLVMVAIAVPGVTAITSTDGSRFDFKIDRHFWSEEKPSMDETFISLRFWFDIVMMKVFELFNFSDDDVEGNIKALDDGIKDSFAAMI